MNPLSVTALASSLVLHALVAAAVFGVVSWGGDDDKTPPLKMVTIEAALAYKSKDAPKQPQKQRVAPKDKKKPQGVSRDADKKPDPNKKPEDKEEQIDFEQQFKEFQDKRRNNDDEDLELGDETPRPGGAFDGSEHGFAEVSKGDPYLQELAADVYNAWKLPTLEKGNGTAVGCVRLHTEGHVVDTKFWKRSENANIDRSVELALDKIKKKRVKGSAKAVPVHLKQVTEQWTCFNFTP